MLLVREAILLSLMVLIVATVALVPGCQPSSSSIVSEAETPDVKLEDVPVLQEDDQSDVLQVVLWGEVTLNPAEITSDDLTSSLLARHLYRRLVHVCPRGDVHPDVAIKWRSEEGGRVWKFEICQEAVMHDGTPITAELLRDIYANAADDSPLARRLRDLKRVEASDEGVLRFFLKEPDPDFPSAVAGDPALSIGLLSDGEGVVGSGPYQFIRHSSRGGIILRAVDPDGEVFPAIEFFPLSPDAVDGSREQWSPEVGALLGGADAVVPFGPEAARRLTVALGLREELGPSPNVRGIVVNDRGILEDVRVRRALFSAVGRGEELLDVSGSPYDSLLPVDTWLPAGHSLQEDKEARMSLQHSTLRVAAELEDAGLKRREDGTWQRSTEVGIGVPIRLTFLVPEDVYAGGEKVARLAADNLEDAGLPVDLEVLQWSSFSSRFFASDYDLALIGWSRPTPAASELLRPWLDSGGAVTINRGDHLQLDALFRNSDFSAARVLEGAREDFRLLPLYSVPIILALGSEVDADWKESFIPLLIPRE